MYRNVVKEKLKRGETVAGLFCNIPSPMVVEILGYAGFDFVIIDAEHGIADYETAEHMIRATEVSNTIPIARIGLNLQQHILRFLDAGAMGVQIPLINTREEALNVVKSTKYPPVGERGLAPTRASQFGLTMPLGDYVKMANQEVLVVIQIETLQAVDNLKDILTVDQVDVVFFGPTDLSSSLGIPGDIANPRVVELIERCGKHVTAAGKAAGVLARDPQDFREWRARGFQYICTNASSMLSRAASNFVSQIEK